MTTTDIVRIEDDGLGQELLLHRIDFARMLGGADEAERFIQEAYSALNANPFLRRCTPQSLFGALYFGAQLGLPVGGPLAQFHLTPREVWNPKIKAKEWQVVPVIGYNGLITLAMNTGEYDAVEGKLVHEKDEFEEPWEDEAGTHFKLKPATGDRGEVIGVIGRALVKGADRSIIEYLTVDDIIRWHRPKIKWEKTPWGTHPDQMYRKTGVRVASKYTAKRRESWRFANALEGDGALVTLAPDGELIIDHEDVATEDWEALIKATDDKADLEKLWKRMGAQESPAVVEQFTPIMLAHAATLTKDSRPPKDKPSQAEIEAAAIGHEPERGPAEPTPEEYAAMQAEAAQS